MKIYNTKNIWQFESTLWGIAGKLGIDLDMNQVSGNCWTEFISNKNVMHGIYRMIT